MVQTVPVTGGDGRAGSTKLRFVGERFLVTGGNRLAGEVAVGGAKNSVLKLMAAALLAEGTNTNAKFHDIPNTVAGAVKAISKNFKPAYLNVHASGGEDMMKAAKDACDPTTKLLSVTVLTSMNEDNLRSVGQGDSTMDQVQRLALLTKETGLDGVVCSSHEIEVLRRECGRDFILMVPGIRPADADLGDQKRVMTPKQAMQNGATHLVIGRPITEARDPVTAAQKIIESLE